MSNLRSFFIKSQLYVDSISTAFRNNLFTNSCQQKNTFCASKFVFSNIRPLNSWQHQVPLIFVYFFCQVRQVLQESIKNRNMTNSNFHLFTTDNSIKTVYIFSREISVATSLIKVVHFKEVYIIFGERSTFPFSKLIS